jgi:hypothetical protein
MPESPQVGHCRKISAGLWASDGQKTAAEAVPQGSSRRGRPARLRDLYLRYACISTAMTNAIAATLKVAIKMLSCTVYVPSVYTIKPIMIEEVKYQNIINLDK